MIFQLFLFVDFEGPDIYNQFSNGVSINSETGSISFIIHDLSDIDSYSFNTTINGYWTVIGNVYTFFFNDISILEGLTNIKLTSNDSLGYESELDISLLFDRTTPVISNIAINSYIMSDICEINVTISDISQYTLGIALIQQSSGISISNIEFTIIELSENNWQITFDSSQLPNGYYDIRFTSIDLAGNVKSDILQDIYFDNSFPQMTSIDEQIYADSVNVYNNTINNEMYINDEEYITISAYDQTFDNFDWSSNLTLATQLGVSDITMYYTYPLTWINISIAGSLDYEQLVYEITGYGDPININTQNILGIQQLKIADHPVSDFTVLLDGASLLIRIGERYRYLLSPQYTKDIFIQFYEFISDNNIGLTFDTTTEKWDLTSPGLNYFNISQYLTLTEGDQFQFWFSIEDGVGNQLHSSKITGIYDNFIGQDPIDQDLFNWQLGTTSPPNQAGVVIFGSDNYTDSTIQINASSILHDISGEEDISRIFIYGSEDEIEWEIVGRAYYSGEESFWNYYWNGDMLDTLPPEDYFLKALIFDKAGNYLTQINQIKIFDYTQIELLTDLVFGHIFDYNFTALSNEQEIGGIIENFFGTTNIYDVIAEYYSPLERQWIPLSTDSATILSNGTYSITWDINRDVSFYLSMDDYSYEYLPLQVVPPSSTDLWGSWGVFSDNMTWQPIIVSEINDNLDITVYEFDNETGWEIDISLSNEVTIPSISGQTFKLFDINADNQFELIRLSSSQIDVIYLDGSSEWIIMENVTSLEDYEYFSFDVAYDGSSSNTFLAVVQKDTFDELSIWKYQFESDYLLTQLENCVAPTNFIPTTVKILNSFSDTNDLSILVGGRIEGLYYSQLFEYDWNLNFKNVLINTILGEITIIEYGIFDNAATIILGVERATIGKMDAVITLRRKASGEEWIEMELSGFDDVRFEILDLLTIQEDNMNKLIIASKTGVFETKITNIVDITTIISPIIFTFEMFSKQELQPDNYPTVTLKNTPINSINKISYRLTGSSQWQGLISEKYRYSRTEVRLDLLSIYSNLDYILIAYSFESFTSEQRSAIDPSFQKYSGTSDTQSSSASATFFDDTSLPLLWLNPGTTYTEPYANWNSLPNGMTYQSTPVISGLGTRVVYPTITSGWGNNYWGTEYTDFPELENSLIYYGDDETYDSGILSEQLNGKEYSQRDLIEDEFDGKFEGNYIDGVWYSNPYVSNNYDFSKMYDSEIHKIGDGNYYNSYDYDEGGAALSSQYVMFENDLIEFNPDTSSNDLSGIYSSGSLPVVPQNYYLTGVSYNEGDYEGGSLDSTHTPFNLQSYDMLSSLGMTTPPPYPQLFTGTLDVDLEVSSSLLNKEVYLSCQIYTTISTATPTLSLTTTTASVINYVGSGGVITVDRELISELNPDSININAIMYSDGWNDPIPIYETRIEYFKLEIITNIPVGYTGYEGTDINGIDNALANWGQYLTSYIEEDTDFGFEFTYDLPAVGINSIEQIYISFSASIITSSEQPPLSVLLYNFIDNRYEALPVGPINIAYTDAAYKNIDDWYGFWNPNILPFETFKPTWKTDTGNYIQTISFGESFPNTISFSNPLISDSTIVFDPLIKSGGNFLNNAGNDPNFKTDATKADYDKGYISFYDSTSPSVNKFSLSGLSIDPNNLFTYDLSDNFPQISTALQFSKKNFNNYLNADGNFRISIISESGSSSSTYFCIGDFRTHTLANTLYLNYDDFDLASKNDYIEVTDTGLLLQGNSGIRTEQEQPNLKFSETFLGSNWILDGTQSFNVIDNDALNQKTYIRQLYPNAPDYWQDTELRVRYNTDTNRKYVTDYILTEDEGIDPGSNNIDDLQIYGGPTQIYFDPSPVIINGDFMLVVDLSFGYDFNLLDSTEYSVEFGLGGWNDNVDFLEIGYYNKDNEYITQDWTSFGNLYTTIDKLNFTSDPAYQRLYFRFVNTYDIDNPNFQVWFNYIWLTPKQDEIRSYLELREPEYLINDYDTSFLEFNTNYVSDPSTIKVYGAYSAAENEEFHADTLTWNNNYVNLRSLISNNLISSQPSTTLDFGSPSGGIFALTTYDKGIDLSTGFVMRTDTISKFYQGNGMLYVQTNTNDDLMNVKSPQYSPDITLEKFDQLHVRFQTNSEDLVNFKFYNNDQEIKDYEIILSGNTNEQILHFPIDEGMIFDQIGFSVKLDNKEYFIIKSISISSDVEEDFELETIISSYSFDSYIYNEGNNVENSPKETEYEDSTYWTIGSEQEGIDEKTEVEFGIEIKEGDIEGVERFEIQMVATCPTPTMQLDTQYFAYYSFSTNQYISITPTTVNGDLLTFDLTSIEDFRDGELYKIWFKFIATDPSYFEVSIDMAQV
ncbi:hypothetical protein LCGC14_1014410, partial [marine sediment metagenome]